MLSKWIPPAGAVRDELACRYQQGIFTEDRGKTVEINAIQFIADDPGLFCSPDQKYIDQEFKWYLKRDLNIKGFPGKVPKIWELISDPHGNVNSNYGYLVYDAANHFQFQFAFNQLKKNLMTRRAVIQFNRPSMAKDYNLNGMNDYVCTYAYQFIVRDNRLDLIVFMRSNDAVYGYPNDLAWARFVHGNIYDSLAKTNPRLEKGQIIWNCGSLHVYERHFYLIDQYIATGNWAVDKKEAKKKYGDKTSKLGPILLERPAGAEDTGELPAETNSSADRGPEHEGVVDRVQRPSHEIS